MNLLPLFLRTAAIGMAIAAPVGPMSLLCMRRTLTRGWRHGIVVGGGIATGDASYALIAALGLAGVSHVMLAHERPLHLAAGLFILFVGLNTFFAPRRNDEAEGLPKRRSWVGDFAGTALLTMTNPPTIIMFAALFTALSPRSGFAPITALLTVAGVFIGSLLWWCGVVGVMAAFRHAIGRRARTWISRVAGAALAVFGLIEVRRALITAAGSRW